MSRDPLQRLEAMTSADTAKRASQKAANRARFPWLAEMIDSIGPDAKLVWACDADGEIGKRPTLDPNHFEMSAESIVLLNELNARIEQRDRKGKRWK